MTTEIPENVTRTFARYPLAQAVCMYMGAPVLAQFDGVCRLTGLPIGRDSTQIRRLEFWTRSGRWFSAYVPQHVAELLEFRHMGEGEAISRWTFASALDVDLSTLPVGATLRTLRYGQGATQAWRCMMAGARRVWRSNGDSSDAQLMAAQRRGRLVAYQVELP